MARPRGRGTEGPDRAAPLQLGAGWEGPGRQDPGGFCPRTGKRTPGTSPRPRMQEAMRAFPGQAKVCTYGCISVGQTPTTRLSAAPLSQAAPRVSVPHLCLSPAPALPPLVASPLCPQDHPMGFSSELCSPQGHGALQQMQEAELRLLEGMRKWMAQRVKSDREYAGLLHHMSLQDSGAQSRSTGFHSPISQVGLHNALGPSPPSCPHQPRNSYGCRCICQSLPFRAPTGEGWRFGRPRLGTSVRDSLPPPSCAIVLGRYHQPDRGPEPTAEAAR